MISINARRLALATRFMLVLLLVSYPPRASATPQPAFLLDGLASLVETVQRESMLDPSEALLMRGATEGLRDFLEKRGDRTTMPLQTTVSGFRQRFDEAAARHPEIARTEMYYAAMRGMLAPLDEPYTRFLTPQEYGHLQARVEGTDESGLGCHLELDADLTLTVAETFPHAGPGEGLATGDRILAINGRPTGHLSLTTAKELLAGADGSRVRLTVRRDEKTFDLQVARTRTEIPNVTWEMLDGRVGYVRLRTFAANVARELDVALEALERRGATSLVLDLRDNRGGYVASAVDVCSRFLPPRTRVMSLQQKRRPPIGYETHEAPRRGVPIVLMVNQRSASASEIVAGCLQDYRVATLLGTRTYGKGLVQKVFPLPDGSACTISTGKYLTARGRDLHKHGIAPDIVTERETFTPPLLDPQVRQAAGLVQGQHTGSSATNTKHPR